METAAQLSMGLLLGSVVWAQTPPTYDYVNNGVQSASVDNSTGVPRLMINGQPVPPILFFFNTQVPASVIAAGVNGLQYLAPQMQDANAAGIHIFSMGFDSWPWDAGSAANPPGFSASDQEIAQLLKIDPQAVFLLRIPVSPPANWSGWANYAQWGPNEDNLYLDGTSAPISIASNVYFQGFIAGVKLMVQHYESSSYASHILGYHIAGQNTGEWFPANYRSEGLDYSPASTTAFRSWLLQKYGTDQALSNAWGYSVTIAKAPVPVPAAGSFPIAAAVQGATVQEFYSLPSEQNMVDYSDYISDEISSRVLGIAQTVRTATAGKRLIAFFHGYIYDLPGSMTGHLRMNQILASPDIDIVAAPISYNSLQERLAGGAGGSMSARDSVTLHGKLWMNEDDLFTYLCANLPNPNYNGNLPTADFFETYNVLLRNLASTMIHRGGTWWMDLNSTGCFNDPNLWSVISNYGLPLYNEIYSKPTPYRPEVAVITDDRSVIYQRSAWDFMINPRTLLRNAIAKTGASVGYYDLSDFISGLLPPTKVYIFANAFSLSDSQITAIRTRLQREGATAIWQYAPGYIGTSGPDVSQSQALTGIQLAVASGYSGSTGDSLMENIVWGWAWETPWDVLSPRLIVTDPNVTGLGHYWSDSAVSTASKQVDGFESIFVGDVGWNTQMLTQLLTAAGVHIWTTGNDVIHTDGSYLVVHAGTAGKQNISLPAGVAASSLSGTVLATNPQPLQVMFSRVGETQWFRLSKPEPLAETPQDWAGTGFSGALLYDPILGQSYTAISNANGTYTDVPNLFTPGFNILRTGDFNGDGKADLILYNSKTASAYIGFGKGDGTFNFQSLFWSPGYDTVVTGDINGDGKTDVALYNSTTGTLYTGISNGDGTFTYEYHLVSQNFTTVRMADFSGNGKADLFLYRVSDGLAYLGIGDGTGAFTFNPLSISAGYNLADTGDLNGDGKADIILYNVTNGNAATGISNGSGGFTFTPLVFSPGFTSVRLGRYTGHVTADVTVYNKNTGVAYFGTGNGAGNFNFISLFWSPGYDYLIPEDVNGDGKTDVVLYNSSTGTEYTGIGNGDGTFSYTYSYWGLGKVLAQ